MSPSSLRRARVSVEEYLAAEATASEKHILWDGEVFPATDMSGGSFDHNTICANTIIALGGRAEPYPGAPDVLTNPLLILEVLSEGTERFDRGEKYRGIPLHPRNHPSLANRRGRDGRFFFLC